MKYISTIISIVTLICSAITVKAQQGTIETVYNADVCIYGATSAGIAASIAVAREGYSVVMINPWHHIGGVLGTGFRMSQDVPYNNHLGGLTKVFYNRDLEYPDYRIRHRQAVGKFNISSFQSMLNKYDEKIKIIKNHRIESVKKSNTTIKSALFEHAPRGNDGVPTPFRLSQNLIRVKAKVFIDASYVGDLMAMAGVSYRIGKESQEKYGESLAGTRGVQKFPGVSPYVEAGNPSSGLLSFITPDPLGQIGGASRFFNGVNFKLAFETNPSKEHPGILIQPPQNRKKDVYTLLRRYKKAGYSIYWPHENQVRFALMTTAIPGAFTPYPEADWETRAKIWRSMINHIKILNDFTGKSARLVSGVNDLTGGWPLIYIRGTRRMIGSYIMTQEDIQLQTNPPTPIGMGYYAVDIYPGRSVVLEDGTLATVGGTFILVSPGPYQIPYGSIIPKEEESTNLLVPVSMSASFVAYSSIRMAATFMVMGESAGIAAALAIKENTNVQDINRQVYTDLLKMYGQKLQWDGEGYRVWRYNVRGEPVEKMTPWWVSHPEEYQVHSVSTLRE